MNRIEKFTRIITIPAIVSGLTVLVLYLFVDNAMSTADFIVSEVCLLLIPALAYPIREIFHIGKDRREGQRSTAMVFSAASYVGGLIWALITNSSPVTKVLFFSYVISVAVLIILNKLIRFKASGHACSTTAPTVILAWQLNAYMLIPCALLISAVYRSSIKLKQHTLPQLLTGSAISVCAGFLGILVFA